LEPGKAKASVSTVANQPMRPLYCLDVVEQNIVLGLAIPVLGSMEKASMGCFAALNPVALTLQGLGRLSRSVIGIDVAWCLSNGYSSPGVGLLCESGFIDWITALTL
jgi:hypothetical protein